MKTVGGGGWADFQSHWLNANFDADVRKMHHVAAAIEPSWSKPVNVMQGVGGKNTPPPHLPSTDDSAITLQDFTT